MTNKYILSGMMMAAFFSIAMQGKAQSTTDDKIKFEFHGFVNHEIVYDTRQVKTAREGEVLMFPLPKSLDANGEDINDKGELNMFNLHSRMQVGISGPTIGNYKTSAFIEGDFVGSSDAVPNMIRMRHFYVKLANEKTEWILGQYWHPMFVPECFPDVLSWNGAFPINAFSRNPQIRFTYNATSALKLTAAAVAQRDFSSYGPSDDGKSSIASSVFLRRSEMPEFQAQAMYRFSPAFVIGATGGYKTIMPRLKTSTNLVESSTLGSYNLNIFSSYKTDKLSWLIEGIYGQNMSSLMMIGGYSIKSIDASDHRSYTNINTLSAWTDISYQINDKWKVAVYGGVAQNMGSDENTSLSAAQLETYGIATNMDKLTCIAPRVSYTIKNFRLGVEIYQLTADYGTINPLNLEVENTSDVSSTRFLFSTMYKF